MSNLFKCISAISPTPSILTPKPRDLRDPLILVLGQMTAFTAGVFVEMARVIDAVIVEAGYDPKNLPGDYDRKSRTNGGNGAGIDRNIQLAFRYGYRDCNPPLTQRGPQAGYWGLADAGVVLAQDLAPKPLPQSRTFAEPMLRALGKITGHTLEPVTRQAAMDATLTEAGYDLAKMPRGWMDPSSNSQPKIHESLRWAARSISTLVTFPARGLWALTPLGLEKAARYNDVILAPAVLIPVAKVRPTGPNATSMWLDQHLKGGSNSELMCMMRGALIKHLPLSASRGLIEDHIHNFMVRVIRRDSFASALTAVAVIPYSKVASYCVNSGRTDARNMGTEPVCREMLGARTDKERQTTDEVGYFPFMDDSDPLKGAFDTDGSIVATTEESEEVQQGANLDFDVIWKQIEGIIQERKPGAWGRYSNLLMLKVQGLSTQEIADKEGVSKHRAAKMLATVRQFVRESCEGMDLEWAY